MARARATADETGRGGSGAAVEGTGPLGRAVRRGAWAVARLVRSVGWRMGLRGSRVDPFHGSGDYWERRYARGGRSGRGSRGELAVYKAEVVNRFVADRDVRSVVELGAGDGDQLALFDVPSYLGLDISPTAVAMLRERFAENPKRQFALYDGEGELDPAWRAELALSLDVIYHLVEDAVFDRYMRDLFAAARRYVLIYSSDEDREDGRGAAHVRHRRFTGFVEAHMAGWTLEQVMANPYPERTPASFYVYRFSGG